LEFDSLRGKRGSRIDTTNWERRTARYYGLTFGAPILAAIIATLLRLALTPVVGSAVPFVTYFAASILLAWYLGFWPAALSILLSIFAGVYYFLGQGQNAASPWGRTERAAVVGFALSSLTVSFLIDFQRRTLARARSAEQAQATTARDNARLLMQAQQTQDELRRLNEDLTRANSDLEVFAYSASHDLREPLRNISVFAEVMQKNFESGVPNENGDLLAHILSGARRMHTVMDDLLTYSRVTTFEEGPAPTVDANSVVAEVLQGLMEQIRDTGAAVTTADLPLVAIHRTRLAQLFQNLISNGIKYRSTEAPEIHISADTRDGQSLFSVADNGIGIEEQYGEQIFGLFKRLHGRDEYPGNGVGLAICKRVVEHYGGRIWLERSEPGRGSTFCFSVPTADVSKSAGH
jgi:signal transduction histidine kinase